MFLIQLHKSLSEEKYMPIHKLYLEMGVYATLFLSVRKNNLFLSAALQYVHYKLLRKCC